MRSECGASILHRGMLAIHLLNGEDCMLGCNNQLCGFCVQTLLQVMRKGGNHDHYPVPLSWVQLQNPVRSLAARAPTGPAAASLVSACAAMRGALLLQPGRVLELLDTAAMDLQEQLLGHPDITKASMEAC